MQQKQSFTQEILPLISGKSMWGKIWKFIFFPIENFLLTRFPHKVQSEYYSSRKFLQTWVKSNTENIVVKFSIAAFFRSIQFIFVRWTFSSKFHIKIISLNHYNLANPINFYCCTIPMSTSYSNPMNYYCICRYVREKHIEAPHRGINQQLMFVSIWTIFSWNNNIYGGILEHEE